MPDIARIFGNCSVGREASCGSGVYEQFPSKAALILIVAVSSELCFNIRRKVEQHEVVVSPVPACAVQQRIIKLSKYACTAV